MGRHTTIKIFALEKDYDIKENILLCFVAL